MKTSSALALSMTLLGASVGMHTQTDPAQRRAGTTVRVDLIGDSTQTANAGYGRGFCANLSPKVDCLNMAKGGASTKTYREMGLWDRALSTKPDYMLIQFGHNDMESADHNDRQVPIGVYQENLRNFVTEARAHGVKPVLVTPLTRRYFQDDGKIHSDLLQHAAVMKRVATETRVPLIDLQSESIAYLDKIGPEAGSKLGITKKDPQGRTIPDKTHLNWQGSYVFGRMVAVDLGNVVPALKKDVLADPAELPAEGELAMRVIAQQPFKIVLTGDSTVATEGGWGPGFCATLTPNVTCIDLAKNGRSTKSYIDEDLWQQALAEKGNYYFIQFGHNDQKPDPKRHADANGLYAENLRRFIHDVRAIGAIPILVTSLSRRNYKDGVLAKDGLEEYAASVRAVGAEEKATVVDLFSMSQKYLSAMSQTQADAFDMTGHPDEKAENTNAVNPDRTHLNDKGKAVFGRMVTDNVVRIQVELGPNVNGLTEGATPVLQVAPTDGR